MSAEKLIEKGRNYLTVAEFGLLLEHNDVTDFKFTHNHNRGMEVWVIKYKGENYKINVDPLVI